MVLVIPPSIEQSQDFRYSVIGEQLQLYYDQIHIASFDTRSIVSRRQETNISIDVLGHMVVAKITYACPIALEQVG